jgi:hypothetical protein
MAGNAELRLFGTLHVNRHARADAHHREDAQGYKRENLSRDSDSYRGTHEKHRGQRNRQYDQLEENST